MENKEKTSVEKKICGEMSSEVKHSKANAEKVRLPYGNFKISKNSLICFFFVLNRVPVPDFSHEPVWTNIKYHLLKLRLIFLKKQKI